MDSDLDQELESELAMDHCMKRQSNPTSKAPHKLCHPMIRLSRSYKSQEKCTSRKKTPTCNQHTWRMSCKHLREGEAGVEGAQSHQKKLSS